MPRPGNGAIGGQSGRIHRPEYAGDSVSALGTRAEGAPSLVFGSPQPESCHQTRFCSGSPSPPPRLGSTALFGHDLNSEYDRCTGALEGLGDLRGLGHGLFLWGMDGLLPNAIVAIPIVTPAGLLPVPIPRPARASACVYQGPWNVAVAGLGRTRGASRAVRAWPTGHWEEEEEEDDL